MIKDMKIKINRNEFRDIASPNPVVSEKIKDNDVDMIKPATAVYRRYIRLRV